MQKESTATLLRIFIGENDKYEGKNLYKYLAEYLKEHQYAGVTILRGIEGFGKASRMHTADLLELSSDLPIVIEVVDTQAKIDALKKTFDETDMIGSGLIIEETIKVIRYEKD